jgi:hypothetical protein
MKHDLASMADTSRQIAAPWPCHVANCPICRGVDRAFFEGVEMAERNQPGAIPKKIRRTMAAASGWRSRRYALRTGAPMSRAKLRAMAGRIMQAAHDAGRVL